MNEVWQTLVSLFPQHWQQYVVFAPFLWAGLCGMIIAFWHAPCPQSRWVPLYNIINKSAFNFRAASNAFQVGKTAIMVPRNDKEVARSVVVKVLQIPKEDTHP